MTSRRSYTKIALLLQTLKRNIWAIAISLLSLFFVLPMATAMRIQSMSQAMLEPPQGKSVTRQFAINQIANTLGKDNLSKLVLCVLAMIVAGSLFSYLHNRKKIDFYYSLPMKRTKLFVQDFVAGVVIVLPAYFIMQGIAVILTIAMGFQDAVALIPWPSILAMHTVFFLLLYALMVLCMVLCGNTIVSLLLFGWATFSIPVAIAMGDAVLCNFFQTYTGIDGWYSALSKWSAFGQYLEFNMDLQSVRTWTILVIYAAATAVLIAFACFLSNIRKSEQAGNAIAFDKLKLPLKLWCVTVMGMSVAIFLYNVSGVAGSLWIFIGFMIGAILTHFLMEIIYDLDFKAFFRHGKTLLVYLAVAILCLVSLQCDFLNYDAYVPDLDEVSAVNVLQGNGVDLGIISHFSYMDLEKLSKMSLCDAANIEEAIEIAQLSVESLQNNTDNAYMDVFINFYLKNGRIVQRRYPILNEEKSEQVMESADAIFASTEYQTKCTTLFTMDLQGEDILYVYNNQSSGGYHDGNDFAARSSDAKEIAEIIEALREDTVQLSEDVWQNEAPVMALYVQYGPNSHMTVISERENMIPVFASCKKTLALIDQIFDVQPVPVYDSKVISATIHVQANVPEKEDGVLIDDVEHELRATVTDPQDLQALLAQATIDVLELSHRMDTNGTLPDGRWFTIMVEKKNGFSNSVFFSKQAEVPVDLIAKYCDI